MNYAIDDMGPPDEHEHDWMNDGEMSLLEVRTMMWDVETRAQQQIPRPPVRCAWCDFAGDSCGMRFDSVNGVTLMQGHDVASVVSSDGNGEWLIGGGYGSTHFDMSLFRFVKNAPTAPVAPICDGCIQLRLDAGDIKLVSESFL